MNKKKYLLLVPCLAAVCAASVTAGIGIVSLANGNDGWSEYTLNDEYGYKTTFQVTDRTFTVDGESYDASAIVCYPDGSVSSAKNVVLNQAGIYTVKYSVQAGGKVYADSDQFLVNYPAYDVLNTKSSVSYGTPARASKPGVMATLAQGDKLVFTEYIDFSKVALGDNLVKGYVTPSTPGAMDFTELVLTFTDSVDPSVYFQVHHYGYDWTYNTYVAVNGNNQQPVGIHPSEGKHTGDGYGLWSCVPFNSMTKTDGVNVVIEPDASEFFVTMDYEQKTVYGQGFISQTSLIADLDNPEHFKQSWFGFPSGKARLSVSAAGYTGATASLCITEVFGLKDLSNNLYIDSGDPTITVDEAFDEGMPKAMVGHDYAIPAATAYDAYALDCPVDVEVWYNYGLDSAANVPIVDGKFTTDKVGTYAIVYTTSDIVGNSVSEVKWVRAFTELGEAEIIIPAEKTTSALAGEWVTVPVLTGEDVIGADKATVEAFVEFGGNRTKITDGFRPESDGTYKVVYVATDYVGNVSEDSYDVTVTIGDKPILERNFAAYPAYISGGKYVLPSYYAYEYVGGKLERKLCDVIVTDGNGATTYKAGDEATISVQENGDPVTLVVKCGETTLATHESAGILAWVREEVGLRFHCENYMYGEGYTTEKTTASGIILTAAADEAFGFTYANALSSRYVSMVLANFVGADADTTVTVTLTDAMNTANSVSLVLGAEGDEAYFAVEGKKSVLTATPFGASNFAIEYENGVFTVNGTSVALDKFAGFESDKVFLSIDYAGYGENASLTFVSLGNVTFTTAVIDRIGPHIFSRHEMGGTYAQGDLYTIHGSVVYDVYSPNFSATMTVTDSTGAIAKDVNGVLLKDVDPSKDYQLKLDVIGRYIVSYNAQEDTSFMKKPNPITLTYALTVRDEVAPTITWNSAFATTLKVGETFVVPEYTVSDNHTAASAIQVYVYVETPKHQLLMLPGNSIRMTQEGEYLVRVMAVDEEGNIASETHVVTVKGA